ncbi:CocE/NonD family hydrolase [Kiloniella sp. EL199]|uniref:CocE/NonD family hydrolase n=1 Tax=Kiloniella sp. EL199 TaxID=2107581 RepID=UPI000EA0C66B|nr:CocE/NonD family hydrolase [Kiloniella sp. EL199]
MATSFQPQSNVTQHDGFCVWENIWIPLKDGRQLSARIWMPDLVEVEEGGIKSVPAIFEYLPYRKRDGTAQRDESTYPVFAKAGYAGIRVDISGTGESDGVFDDEYSPRELADGVEAINWIAEQHWCNGKLGMMGISWGGFNALQIAALRPEPLKAIISIGSTVDRYNSDIHYKSGCHLNSNLSWSGVMQCFANRPPDPDLVGDKWRDMWLDRLEGANLVLDEWLSHQRYDDFWKHGSIEQDYGAVEIPSLVISGWADAYKNAPPEAAKNMPNLTKAINGPWVHKYPHFAYPHPRSNFHQEALRWWDRWLCDEQNEAESLPAYRAYISQNVKPSRWREHEEGRWVKEETWPSNNISMQKLYLNADHSLTETSRNDCGGRLSICSPEDTGIACGEVFALKPDTETPGDQRIDDGGSLVFETDILSDAIEILGQPTLSLNVAIDAPLGNLAVRLIDVHPDGVSHRVCFGVLNLAHRHNNETPKEMIPGQAEDITVILDHIGYRFLPGHRIRVSISTAYWPLIMPSPYHVTASISLGENTALSLPARATGNQTIVNDEIHMPEPEDANPLPAYKDITPSKTERRVEKDLAGNRTHYITEDDTGTTEILGHALHVRHTSFTKWSVNPDTPLGAEATSQWCCYMSRDGWSIKLETDVSMVLNADNFDISGKMNAYEGDKEIFARDYQKAIPRDHM